MPTCDHTQGTIPARQCAAVRQAARVHQGKHRTCTPTCTASPKPGNPREITHTIRCG